MIIAVLATIAACAAVGFAEPVPKLTKTVNKPGIETTNSVLSAKSVLTLKTERVPKTSHNFTIAKETTTSKNSSITKFDCDASNKFQQRPFYNYTTLKLAGRPCRFTHAESPVWDGETDTLYWVDVLEGNVYALDFKTDTYRVNHLDSKEVNLVTPIEDSCRVLIGKENSIYLMDWDEPGDKGLSKLATFDDDMPGNILNEGKADATGRFWGGTKGPQTGSHVKPDHAAFYSLNVENLELKVHLKPVSISNGFVWSHNNSVLYYIDSATKTVDALDFDMWRPHIGNRRTIIDLKDYNFGKRAIPDGITIDRDGYLWVAIMFGGEVIRVDPNRRIIVEKFMLPSSQITSLTWGGCNYETLFVTTSQRDMKEEEKKKEPTAGAIFLLYGLGTGGLPAYKFVFPYAESF